MNSEPQDTFLSIVRVGIGTARETKLPDNIDWQQIKTLADEQGLTAVVLDGIEIFKCSKHDTLKPQLKLEWIGEVLQNYEARYKQYEKAIGSLAGWYNNHRFKMMLLKGYACSLDWPRPNHRPTGDIDIWQFGQWKDADTALTEEEGITINNSHHHHTVFEWNGFMVENHYDFINIHHHRSHANLEKIFKELGMDDSNSVDVDGERVYLPSPNLHALFLLKHAALHFVGTELTFRQILDWAFFIQKHGKDVDWEQLFPIIEEHGMVPFLNIINAICIEELGFDARIFPIIQFDEKLKDRVVNEVFASIYHGERISNLFKRQVVRYRRWKGNAWKHELCYRESMWSAFWSGVWGHLLKPKSI